MSAASPSIKEMVSMKHPESVALKRHHGTALRAGGLARADVVGRPFWEASWW